MTQPNIPLAEVAAFADGIGIAKILLAGESRIVDEERSLGLFVHVWTVRDDRVLQEYDSIEDELLAYLRMGIDGFFSDFPDTGVRICNQYLESATGQ